MLVQAQDWTTCRAHRQRLAGLPGDEEEHIGSGLDMECTGAENGVVGASGSSSVGFSRYRSQGIGRGRGRDAVCAPVVDADGRDDEGYHLVDRHCSVWKSILTRLGPGRFKKLEVSPLYLQAKTGSCELRVKTVLGTQSSSRYDQVCGERDLGEAFREVWFGWLVLYDMREGRGFRRRTAFVATGFTSRMASPCQHRVRVCFVCE